MNNIQNSFTDKDIKNKQIYKGVICINGAVEVPIDNLPVMGIEQTGSIFAVSGLFAYFLIPTFAVLFIVLGIRMAIKKNKVKKEHARKQGITSEKQEKFNKKYRKDEDLMKIIPNYLDTAYPEELGLTIYFDKKGKIISSGGK